MEWPQRGRQSQVASHKALSSDPFSSSYIDFGLNIFISKFEDDAKIDNVILSEGDKWSLQEDLHKISDWSVKWEMPFNINKCQILQVGSRNIKNDYEMCGVKIKTVHSVKDLGVSVTSNLKFSQQCNESVIKANKRMDLSYPFTCWRLHFALFDFLRQKTHLTGL